MKKVELKLEVGKIVSKLSCQLIEEGYFIVETHKSGHPKVEAIEFMHPSKETNKAIFVTYKSTQEEEVQEIIVSLGEMEKETSLFFLSTPSGKVTHEVISKLLIFSATSRKHFLITEEELQEIVEKRVKRRLARTRKYHEFEVPKFKTLKGFKRTGGLVTRIESEIYLIYSVVSPKGKKTFSLFR